MKRLVRLSLYIGLLLGGLCLMLGGCTYTPSAAEQAGLTAVEGDVAAAEAESRVLIYPDYMACRLPYNIAPCNFRILSPGTRYKVEIRQGGGAEGIVGGKTLYKQSGRRVVQWPLKQWKQMLSQAKGDTLWVALSLKQNGGWREYAPFPLYIDTAAISPYLTYRLIEPSYQLCGRLTIEERCLENFDRRNLFDNMLNNNACVNCHTSAWGDPNYSIYHVRFERKGSYIAIDGKLRRLNMTSNRFPQGGAYPAWHPDRRYIAFGTGQAIPFVHSQNIVRRTEVFDSLGDIIVYDIFRNRILSDERICTSEKEETFPCFSPDGRKLYFCQSLTPKRDSAENEVDYTLKIKYSLVSVEFDAETGSFGRMDTLVDAAESGKTVSFPRVSLDGRFLVFCLSDHGTFPIRHPESDLYVIDLTAEGSGPYHRIDSIYPERVYRPLTAANSRHTESYHEFSPVGNGHWLMFSSKRDDGMYARPYFCRLNDNGEASKPFMLPQKDPDYYLTYLRSFNVPVFSNGRAPYNEHTTAKATGDEILYPEVMEIAGE